MRNRKCVRNQFGICVKKMCASCLYKKETRAVTLRYCTKKRQRVSPHGVCFRWKMSKQLIMVGNALGVVRDKETKEVIID